MRALSPQYRCPKQAVEHLTKHGIHCALQAGALCPRPSDYQLLEQVELAVVAVLKAHLRSLGLALPRPQQPYHRRWGHGHDLVVVVLMVVVEA